MKIRSIGYLLVIIFLFIANLKEKNTKFEITIKEDTTGLNKYIDFKSINYSLINKAIYIKTNEIRKKHNLKTVEYNKLLEKMAMMHSKDMVEKNFFSHNNPYDQKKTGIYERALFVGIKNPNIAENIAECFGLQYIPDSKVYTRGKSKFSTTPDGELILPHTYLSLANQVIESWMRSPGHRKNILNSTAVQIGCGAYFYYDSSFNDMPMFKVTQNFQLFEPVNE